MMADSKKYSSKLHGKKIIIFGGSSGIGFGVAQACVEFGATVIISSSREDRLQGAIDSLLKDYPSAKDRVSGQACDLKSAEVESNIEKIFDKVGNVDHIVFTAGDKLPMMALQRLDLQNMQSIGHVRYFAAILVTKIGSRYLKKSSECSIIYTSGSIAEHPNPGGWTMLAFYATGLLGLTRQMAFDLAPIRVNTVIPGVVETELWTESMGAEGAKAHLAQRGKENITKHLGTPQDLAEAYLYLMRDQNITGSSISSNSGRLLA